jgi:hypothetical protein
MNTNLPNNQKLYDKVKKEAKSKFKVWPSAYASGWLVKEYINRGGTYKGKKPNKSMLKRWFDEKWINVCKLPKIVKCGRPNIKTSAWKKKYPYCRPKIRISAKTPTTAGELSKEQIKGRCRRKQKSPMSRIGDKKNYKNKLKK